MSGRPGPGDKAPDFELPDDSGVFRTLKSFAGKKLVLYFYPKDNTSGCTREAIDFSGAQGRLRESRDSHRRRLAGFDRQPRQIQDQARSLISN